MQSKQILLRLLELLLLLLMVVMLLLQCFTVFSQEAAAEAAKAESDKGKSAGDVSGEGAEKTEEVKSDKDAGPAKSKGKVNLDDIPSVMTFLLP